jgi:hypothetical protein
MIFKMKVAQTMAHGAASGLPPIDWKASFIASPALPKRKRCKPFSLSCSWFAYPPYLHHFRLTAGMTAARALIVPLTWAT